LKGELCNFTSNKPVNCNEGTAAGAAGAFTCDACEQHQYFDTASKECKEMGTGATAKLGYTAIHPMFIPEKCLYGTYSDATSIGTASSRTQTADC
jgi:hypothetical protein